jgi:MFS family permease
MELQQLARFALPRAVVVLGVASLLNDAASEMVTPLMPIFLTASLGAGPAIVGLVEGFAEATASVLKLVAGWLADRGWSARRLVLGGYALSNVVRPLIGLANAWIGVMVLRFLDRVGKGLRTAPRDALIAAAVPIDARGRAFGFHRSMDHLGAVIGPLLAFALLSASLSMREVFLASGVIGFLLIGLLFFGLPAPPTPSIAPTPARLRWSTLDASLKRLLVASAVLALATTPEAFLVLWATARGVDPASIALLWALASLLKMSLAFPAGAVSDRFGRRAILLAGWTIRVALLLSLSVVDAAGMAVWFLFIGYSGSLALTEAAERSLVGDISPAAQRGTAFGVYHLISGLLILPGAVLFGAIWETAGTAAAFAVAAALTAVAIAFMWRSVIRR